MVKNQNPSIEKHKVKIFSSSKGRIFSNFMYFSVKVFFIFLILRRFGEKT